MRPEPFTTAKGRKAIAVPLDLGPGRPVEWYWSWTTPEGHLSQEINGPLPSVATCIADAEEQSR